MLNFLLSRPSYIHLKKYIKMLFMHTVTGINMFFVEHVLIFEFTFILLNRKLLSSEISVCTK